MKIENGRRIPEVRVAEVSEPVRSDFGMGNSRTLTFYGTMEDLNYPNAVMEATKDWLVTNGCARWSVGETSRCIPLGSEEFSRLGENDNTTHKVTIQVFDPGL